MADSVFLVAGERPDAVDSVIDEVLAGAGSPPVTATTRPDRHGTVVTLVGDGADTVAARARERLRSVDAPAPVGRRYVGPDPTPAPAPDSWAAASPAPASASDPWAAAAPPPAHLTGSGDDVDPTIAVARPPKLRFGDGTVVPLRGRMVFGREPVASGGADAALVTIDDPERAVSKTHFAIEVRDGAIWVEDLGSTNGTSVQSVDGRVTAVAPGAPVRIVVGDHVQFGAFSVTVEA